MNEKPAQFLLDGRDTPIPPVYLEPVRRGQRLDRPAAASLLDTAARACVDAQSIGTRLAVLRAHQIRSGRVFQRLGYRSDADYAREELGIAPRAFRDLARLGGRLEGLGEIKAAFVRGRITRTQAEVIAAVATEADQLEWLERADTGTVRELKAAARRARRDFLAASDPGGPQAPGDNIEPAPENLGSDTDNEPRSRRSFEVPAGLLGNVDATLELARRVAGANMPDGALWELIAAEYLSGAPLVALPEAPADPEDRADPAAPTEPDEPTELEKPTEPEEPVKPEDPRGYQVWLEGRTRNWSFLPRERPALQLEGDWRRLNESAAAENHGSPAVPSRDATEVPVAAWTLHRDLKDALAAERRVAWQLGRLLAIVRNRRLWQSMMFASFAHYVRERLGISSRVAERLIRIDREAWKYAPMRRAWEAGELSPLVADALARLLPKVEPLRTTQEAWIRFARRTTLAHFLSVVRAIERERAANPRSRRRPVGPPDQIAHLPVDEPSDAEAAGFAAAELAGVAETAELSEVGGNPSPTDPPMFVTRYSVWMTDDELETLERAAEVVRDARSAPDLPLWACLLALLDHFRGSYDGEHDREARAKYALFERDGWKCKAPGCSAYGPLHLHHIVFRAHGGTDEPANLVSLCDFHHKALHDGWIRCVGRAPDRLYWELGIDGRDGYAEPPIARIAGHQRLAAHEYWDGRRIRPLREVADGENVAKSATSAGATANDTSAPEATNPETAVPPKQSIGARRAARLRKADTDPSVTSTEWQRPSAPRLHEGFFTPAG